MNFWQLAYTHKWATLDQLKQAVGYNLITTDQYKTITGEDYSTGTATA
ncbi:MAG TPA: XkdX family protein [Ruminococcaceae bacterium]|jgi:hypothetical protein|nr:XkdX family protein [Oscillospiraceae bacterium]HCC02542.1 XkdX family protein [Oscillospiraceae bacterium]HCM24115.1 XkdX family protein [Oscillospiraceae bacterium]